MSPEKLHFEMLMISDNSPKSCGCVHICVNKLYLLSLSLSGLEWPQFKIRSEIFLFAKTTIGDLGLPSFLFSGYRKSFPGVKRSEREVHHSPPPSAEVKNEWNNTSIPLSVASRRVRHNFAIFYLTLFISLQTPLNISAHSIFSIPALKWQWNFSFTLRSL
jgi:hypothetical protein